MFQSITHSDLAAIRDLAIGRAKLGTMSAGIAGADRLRVTIELANAMTMLSQDALAELVALVRLGRDGREGGGGHHSDTPWPERVADARERLDIDTPRALATLSGLDTLIDRGLLALRDLGAAAPAADGRGPVPETG